MNKTVNSVEKADLENVGLGYFISSERVNELNELLENRPMPLQVIQMILEESSSWLDFLSIIENNQYSYVEDVSTDEELGTAIDDAYLPFNAEMVREAGAYNYLDREQIGLTLQAECGWIIYIKYGMAIQINR